VVNLIADPKSVPTKMITGVHWVRNVYCKKCHTKVGWTYELATPPDQLYKERMTVLEVAYMQQRLPITATPMVIRSRAAKYIQLDMLGSSSDSDSGYEFPEELDQYFH